MSWRILYVEESDSLSLYLDNVKVRKGINEFLFPLSDLIMILIDNYKAILSINLMNACSNNNIPIVCCGDNHHPLNILLPLSGHFESSKLLFEQIDWNEKTKKSVWKIIIKRKIKNQRIVLEAASKEKDAIDILNKYYDEVVDFDATNREGLAAKVYFHALFGPKFSRGDDNVVNACLNYGYSIFRSLISKTIVAKGLNPKLGIFHKGAGNEFNLSDDIIEVFRPIIDLFVFQNFKEEKIFIKDHRLKLLSMLNGKIVVDEQKVTINHAIESITDEIIKAFRDGHISKIISFEPYIYDL